MRGEMRREEKKRREEEKRREEKRREEKRREEKRRAFLSVSIASGCGNIPATFRRNQVSAFVAHGILLPFNVQCRSDRKEEMCLYVNGILFATVAVTATVLILKRSV